MTKIYAQQADSSRATISSPNISNVSLFSHYFVYYFDEMLASLSCPILISFDMQILIFGRDTVFTLLL